MSRTLSNFQINEYFSKNKRFGGCCCKDELVDKKPGNKFWIINMQDSKDGNGTHWVLVYDCEKGSRGPSKRCIYFDSYGISPPEEIKEFMRKSKSRWFTQTLNIKHSTLLTAVITALILLID